MKSPLKSFIVFSFLVVLAMGECHFDEDCYNGSYYCRQRDNSCTHKNIFPAYSPRAWIGIGILFLMSIMTNTAGIGGGTVLAPIFFIFFDFIGSEAAFLSKSTIFAGAFANLIFIAAKRDPNQPSKLLVDYKLATILLPSCLIGTSMGVPLSNFLPNGLIFTMQACILMSLIYRVYKQTKQPKEPLINSNESSPENSPKKTKENEESVSGGQVQLTDYSPERRRSFERKIKLQEPVV